DHAAALGAEVVIADGLLQSAPERLAASVLVLDARAPFGAGACPPLGDLRAPVDALLAASTVRAVITEDAPPHPLPAPLKDAILVQSTIATASAPGEPPRALATLRGQRVGLLLTVARPERIVTSLRPHGITPSPVLALADHAAPSERDLAEISSISVDVWLTTGRCAVKLPPRLAGAPILALDHQLDIGVLADRMHGI
ncbi:MAG: tetraacyldisaccharide 4'-kinase, partial [Byssovorax sp.]